MNEHRSLTTVNQQIITGMEKYMSAIAQCLIDLHLPWQASACPALSRSHLYTLDVGTRIFNFVYSCPHNFPLHRSLIYFESPSYILCMRPAFLILRYYFADTIKHAIFLMWIFLWNINSLDKLIIFKTNVSLNYMWRVSLPWAWFLQMTPFEFCIAIFNYSILFNHDKKF